MLLFQLSDNDDEDDDDGGTTIDKTSRWTGRRGGVVGAHSDVQWSVEKERGGKFENEGGVKRELKRKKKKGKKSERERE